MSGCCGCNAGGSNTAINRKYIEYWYDKLSNECREIDCGDIMSNHWTCFAEPKCVDGKCQLLPTVEKIAMWQNGEELISDPRSSKHNPRVNNIIKTLHKLNLQATCVFSEEDIQEIKQKDRVVEIVFKNPIDITISQWIEPYRSNAKSDKRGYRSLESVKTVLFILEDNLDGGLEGHILVGHGVEGRVDEGGITIVYSCWTIQQEGNNELDKSWINEIRFKGG